mmetsp:Transcript_19629/g.24205  ORF Transcript_19629/g.24205 Transcript_19629/m.24205 type:complete len:279 (-) Transcript_19629:670-1506(-)
MTNNSATSTIINDGESHIIQSIIDTRKYPIHKEEYISQLRNKLSNEHALTLPSFILETARQQLLQEAVNNQHKAYYTQTSHSVYLSPKDDKLPDNHVYNQQLNSSKGCITTDQISNSSLLKSLYYNHEFQDFLAGILNVKKLYPYADPLSEINVHYYNQGQELNWHFDNSSFAITLLLQAPMDGGQFEYFPNLRDSSRGENGYEDVKDVMDQKKNGTILSIEPSTLVLFHGRDCLHRVRPVIGDRTRILVVLAYNDQPGVCLSEEARKTFFGRTGRED